jgi:hypothetical protein
VKRGHHRRSRVVPAHSSELYHTADVLNRRSKVIGRDHPANLSPRVITSRSHGELKMQRDTRSPYRKFYRGADAFRVYGQSISLGPDGGSFVMSTLFSCRCCHSAQPRTENREHWHIAILRHHRRGPDLFTRTNSVFPLAKLQPP